MNDLQLNDGGWRNYDFNTDSLWLIPKRDSSGQHKGDYHGNFVPQIPYEFISRFTRAGDWVLDVFAGSGTSLICAKELGRNAIGFDVSQEARDITNQRLLCTPSIGEGLQTCFVHDLDALDAASYAHFAPEQFKLIFVHPPYLDIVKFSDDSRCLIQKLAVSPETEKIERKYKTHTMSQMSKFNGMMVELGELLAPVLAPGGHVVYVIGDLYREGRWHFLGFESWAHLEAGANLMSKAVIVKNIAGNEKGKGPKKNLWRYRHLKNGTYDFSHEYIFVGRKG